MNNRCSIPFGLCATRDDTLEQTARSLFDAYAKDGSMELSAVKDVPFVKELLVSVFANKTRDVDIVYAIEFRVIVVLEACDHVNIMQPYFKHCELTN